MGGTWRWMTAPSADAIREYYSDVVVFDGLPPWASAPGEPEWLATVKHVALGDEDDRGDQPRQELRNVAQGS